MGQGFGKDGGQSRECIVGTDSDARNGAIGEDENSSDGVDVLLNLGRNTLTMELVLLDTTSIGQPRRVENANLLGTLRTFTAFNTPYLLLSRSGS